MTDKIFKTIKCPLCGAVWRDEALGSIECPNPDCHFKIDVSSTPKILATIICPECEVAWRDEAPGTVKCPNPECLAVFEVDDLGTPITLMTMICPECGKALRDKAPGSIQCPNPKCQTAFEVDDYGTPIQYTVAIKCPHCRESWQDDAPGIVECPTCKESFEVDSSGDSIVVKRHIICPICDQIFHDFSPGILKCPECDHEFEVDKQGYLISKEIDENTIVEELNPSSSALNHHSPVNTCLKCKAPLEETWIFCPKCGRANHPPKNTETTPKSWQTGEVQLPEYDKERCILVTAKNPATGGIFTVYLKNVSENKNGIVGTEINKIGDEVRGKGFGGKKHIILKGAILKQQEVNIQQKCNELEVPCQIRREAIPSEKAETILQPIGIISERSSNIIKEGNIDRKSYLNLFLKVTELFLSCRAINCMNKAKIIYVGDLVTRTEHELLNIQNMGRKSVCEINSKLSDMGLSLGMKLSEWSQNNVEEKIKLLSDELKIHRKNSAEFFLSDIKRAQYLEEELIYFVEMFSKGKNVQIITSFFGFDGKGKKTLEFTSEGFDCTRERVRQITTKYSENINQSEIVKNTNLPICKKIEKYIEKRLPAEADTIEMELFEKGFTKTTFQLDGIIEAIKLSGDKQPFNIIKIGRKRLVISSSEIIVTKKSTKLILQLSKKLISSYGITNVAEIIDRVFQETGQTLTDQYVILILSVFKNFSWLDKSKGWFWIKATPRNRILNVIQKILSICESINIHELRAGIGRFHRMDCFIPTTSVLLELCKQIKWCRILGNTISANPPIKVEDALGNHELIVYQILKKRGPLMATSDFEAACLDFGISRNSFYQYLSYSPLLARYASSVYGLRGANIQPGLAEAIAPIKKKESTVSDYGWTKDGNIWIIRRLAPSAIHSAVVSIPTALLQYLQESFILKSIDGTNYGNLQIKNGNASSIYSFLKRSGCEAGDYLALTFYLNKKEVLAYIGGEDVREDFIA